MPRCPEAAAKLLRAEFDLETSASTFKRVRSMGPLDQLMKLIPVQPDVRHEPDELDERELDMVDAVISSMTKDERSSPTSSTPAASAASSGSGTRSRKSTTS
jgi:signal recognition particle subunit SRP54